MRIIEDLSGEYKDMIQNYLNLSKYDDDSGDEVLFLGYNTSHNAELKQKYSKFKKRIYLNLEAPCSFITTKTTVAEQEYFTHVYTLCPYTCEWTNDKSNTKFIPIPYPISLDAFSGINETNEKEYDVMYLGTLMIPTHSEIIDVMRNFKYVFASLNNYQKPYTPTHINISSMAKWDLLSRSKINVGVNQAPFGPRYLSNIKSYENWETHKAFTKIQEGTMPQFKSRVTEAMGLKTLNLIKRDEWNVIETWFKPDVHFIYWDNKEDLKNKIDYILNNYAEFQHIIDDAYEEVKKYDIDYLYTNTILK